MKKYPYCLYVFKSTFNAGPDLLKTIRRAKPEDTDWYKKTQIADVSGYGPQLFEYSLKKRWPETDKERKRIRLGRVLELKNGTKILFHKTSNWRIEFLDETGEVIDRCKRNDRFETKLLKIKQFIEAAYPHYQESNTAERIAATLLGGFGKVWLEFVDISKKSLEPLCDQHETPALFWDLQYRLFIYDEELPYYTNKDTSICYRVFSQYTFDWDYFQNQAKGNWVYLHCHKRDTNLKLKKMTAANSLDMATIGALEVIFKAPTDDMDDHCWKNLNAGPDFV
jgi:hypothetical protein